MRLNLVHVETDLILAFASPGTIQTEMFDRAFGEGETDAKKTITAQPPLAASARRRRSPARCSGSVHPERRSPRARTSLWTGDTPHNSRKILGLFSERTKAGLASARTRGRKGGAPFLK